MMGHVAIIVDDALARIGKRDTDLKPAPDHLRRPAGGDRRGRRPVGDHVVFTVGGVAVDRRERAGHEFEQPHLLRDEFHTRQRARGIGRAIQEPGEVCREPHLDHHYGTILRRGKRLSQHRDRIGGVFAVKQIVRIAKARCILLGGQLQVSARRLDATRPDEADRYVGAAVERVDAVSKRARLRMIGRHRHRQQPASAA